MGLKCKYDCLDKPNGRAHRGENQRRAFLSLLAKGCTLENRTLNASVDSVPSFCKC